MQCWWYTSFSSHNFVAAKMSFIQCSMNLLIGKQVNLVQRTLIMWHPMKADIHSQGMSFQWTSRAEQYVMFVTEMCKWSSLWLKETWRMSYLIREHGNQSFVYCPFRSFTVESQPVLGGFEHLIQKGTQTFCVCNLRMFTWSWAIILYGLQIPHIYERAVSYPDSMKHFRLTH